MTNLQKWHFYLKDLESPESFIDWSYYSLISFALQRRVWLDGSASGNLFPNLFVLFIAPPSVGKGQASKPVANIIRSTSLMYLKKDNSVHPMFPCGADTTSMEAFIKELTTSQQMTAEEKTSKPYAHCSCCFVVEEFETLINENAKSIVAVLNQVYDADQFRKLTIGRGEDLVKNVCVSMLASTTPDFIRESFENKIFSQGFMSRFIAVFGKEKRFFRLYPGTSVEQMTVWRQIVDHVRSLHKVCGLCSLSVDSVKWFQSFYESGEMLRSRKNQHPSLDNYWGRLSTHLKKLAMVLHFSEPFEPGDYEIQLPTLQRAWKALQGIEPDMHLAFTSCARNPLHEIQKNIFRFLKHAGKVNRTNLVLVFSREGNMEEIDECIKVLVDTQQVTFEGGFYFVKS